MSHLLDVMVRERREGKTTETIKWLLEDRTTRMLVCVDERRAAFILREHPFLIGRVSSLANWQHGWGRGRDVEVAVDDAESILYDVVGPNLTRITMTGKSI